MARSIWQQLRGRRKLILVWLLLLLFVALVKFQRFCQGSDWQICLSPRDFVFRWGVKLFAILLGLYLVRLVRRPRFLNVSAKSEFALRPEKFDKSIVTVIGRVEYILPDTIAEKVKRKITDVYRNTTNNSDPTNRHSHQRFLISSPQLSPKERVLVSHNLKFGKIKIGRNSWIKVKGEYLHQVSINPRTGAASKYGLIHKTHIPDGQIELMIRPSQEDIGQGVVVST